MILTLWVIRLELNTREVGVIAISYMLSLLVWAFKEFIDRKYTALVRAEICDCSDLCISPSSE
jgi:hypothetical protein